MFAANLRHLGRTLRRSPASAAAAILTLSLTLGAGAAIFAVVDAVILTPPPFADPDALVTAGETPLDEPAGAARPISYATFEAWRDRAGSLAVIEGFDPTNLTLTGLGAARRTSATDVTPGFFTLLGVTPILGRRFSTDDVGRPVAIVSHSFWRDALAADPGVIGREIVLGGQTHAIVGVLPERFVFALDRGDIWRPLQVTSTQAVRAGVRVRAVARLAATVSPTSLAAALEEVSRAASPPARVIATKVSTAITGRATTTLGLLAGAAALAVLIAFTNLAGLLIVRSIDRGRELAVRTALGARRLEIARQLLLEAAAIVAAGTIGGVLLALWLTPVVGDQFRGIASREIAVNWRVIGAMSLLASICAWMSASVPAFIAMRRNVTDVLRRSVTPAPRERLLRRVFVTGVVATAFVLIVSVTLVGRSLLSVLAVNPGFVADGVLTMNVAPPATGYPDRERLVSFYSALHSDLEQRLGVRTVGIVDELPLTGDRGRRTDLIGVGPDDPGREAVIRAASPGYFEVMRIPLVAGRSFDARDNASAPPRVVVSEALAKRLFALESPIGRQIRFAARAQPAEIIGLVSDVTHRALDEAVLPTVYLSAWQVPSRSSFIVVRSARADADVIATVRDTVARLDRDLPVGAGSMRNIVANSPGVPARRVLTLAFMGFALLALALGGIGLFGVVAHDVASRRLELALRVALGANPARLFAATLGQGAWMVGAALVVGGVLSLWTSRALSGFVVSSSPFDLVSLVVASLVLMIVGVGAVLPVARRAARTDPMSVLRL